MSLARTLPFLVLVLLILTSCHFAVESLILPKRRIVFEKRFGEGHHDATVGDDVSSVSSLGPLFGEKTYQKENIQDHSGFGTIIRPRKQAAESSDNLLNRQPKRRYQYFAHQLASEPFGLQKGATFSFHLKYLGSTNGGDVDPTTTIEKLLPDEGPFFFALFTEDLWIFIDSARYNQQIGLEPFICDLPTVKRVPLRDAVEWSGTFSLPYVTVNAGEYYKENQLDKVMPVLMKCDPYTEKPLVFSAEMQFENPEPIGHLSVELYSTLLLSRFMLALWVLLGVVLMLNSLAAFCCSCAILKYFPLKRRTASSVMSSFLWWNRHIRRLSSEDRYQRNSFGTHIVPTDAQQVYDDDLPGLGESSSSAHESKRQRSSAKLYQSMQPSTLVHFITLFLLGFHVLVTCAKFSLDIFILTQVRTSGHYSANFHRWQNLLTAALSVSFFLVLVWIASGQHHQRAGIRRRFPLFRRTPSIRISTKYATCALLVLFIYALSAACSSLCLESEHDMCYSFITLRQIMILLVYFTICVLLYGTIQRVSHDSVMTVFTVVREISHHNLSRYRLFLYAFFSYLCIPAGLIFIQFTFLTWKSHWFFEALVHLMQWGFIVFLLILFQGVMGVEWKHWGPRKKRRRAGGRRHVAKEYHMASQGVEDYEMRPLRDGDAVSSSDEL